MSGCEVWRLPQRDRDRWDVWTLCEAVGGCDQDVCTTMEEISEAWGQGEIEASWPRGEPESGEDAHGADPVDGDWRF